MIWNTGELIVRRVHEGGVHRAIHCIQAGNAHATRQVKGRKITANQNAAIRLEGDGINRVHFTSERIQRSGSGVEGRINRAVRI